MLSARDFYAKCWNNKLGNFRRYSLPEIIRADHGTSTRPLIPTRKSSEQLHPTDFVDWSNGEIANVDVNVLKTYTKARNVMTEETAAKFDYASDSFVWFIAYSAYVFGEEPPTTQFDKLLQSAWKTATDNGVLRYKLDKLETKVLTGSHSFVAQLNPQRALERRAPHAFFSISEPFDSSRFHFGKVKDAEVFFKLNEVHGRKSSSCEDPPKENASFVIANVSPLEYCNVLLVPKMKAYLPQVLTVDALRMGLHVILLSGTWKLRVGFNSIGAMASVNHLHCHAYYLGYNIPTESLPTEHLAGPCHIVRKYPAGGFVFQFPPLERKSDSLTDELDLFIADVFNFVDGLHKSEIPHNVFLTRGTPIYSSMSRKFLVIRVYVWTREFFYGAKDDTAFNAAVCELSGHLPVKTEEHFKNLTEEEVCRVLERATQEMFLKAKPIAKRLFEPH